MVKTVWRVISLLFLFAISQQAFAAQAKLTNVHITQLSDHQWRIVFVVNQKVDHDVFSLPSPDRLIVDFKNTKDVYDLGKLDLSDSPIKDLRHGIHKGYDLRVVFDLKQKLTVKTKTLPFDATAGGWELVIDTAFNPMTNKPIAKPTIKPITKPIAKPMVKPEKPIAPLPPKPKLQPKPKATHVASKAVEQATNQAINNVVNASINTIKKTPSAPTVTPTPFAPIPKLTPKPVPAPVKKVNPPAEKPVPLRDVIVVIDPGHGGKDPGTTGPGGVEEKNVTLAIGKDLDKLVNATPGMTAKMTRTADYYVSLRQRLAIARKDHGDIFIAIHADAFKDPNAIGAAVFALSLHGASSEAARWVAKKENYSELGGVNLNAMPDQSNMLRWVLIDLSQAATIKASVELGTYVIQGLGRVTQLHYPSVQQAPFMVLKSPDIPSILVETGFLSNPYEEARLKTPAYQHKIAGALMYGINQYFAYHAPPHTYIAVEDHESR